MGATEHHYSKILPSFLLWICEPASEADEPLKVGHFATVKKLARVIVVHIVNPQFHILSVLRKVLQECQWI
jgi:hypothetical protein